MKPVKFKHQSIVFAENQPEYQPLPALRLDGPEGNVISCWKLSFKERIRVLFFGRVWLNLMSFNQPLTPSRLATDRKEMFSHTDDNLPIYNKLKRYLKSNLSTKNAIT